MLFRFALEILSYVEVIKEILPLVDILFVSEETSRRMTQKEGTLDEIMKSYADEYGCRIVATTRREVVSPTKHNFGSRIYYDGKFYDSNLGVLEEYDMSKLQGYLEIKC